MARAPLVLLAALLACAGYAAFADGAAQRPAGTRLEVALIVLAVATTAAALYGRRLRIAAPPAAWVGFGLLAAFTIWTALTITWSVAPDRSWAQFDRALAYTLVVGLALVAGSSLARAPERAAMGWVAIAAAAALYALAGKTIPGVGILGIDLDHAGPVSRLREPLGYWNALALACALAVAPALRLTADPAQRPRVRHLALAALYTLFVVIALTYSRGGILGAAAALAVLVALAPQRLRTLALAGAAGVAMLAPILVAFNRDDLTRNALPLEQRTDDALLVLAAFLLAGAALMAGLRLLLRFERSGRCTPERGRRAAQPLATGAAALAAVALIGAIATGALGDLARDFTDERAADTVTDPTRLTSTGSSNRWGWWQEAAGAWSDKPVGGWGAGSFAVTHLMYRKDRLGVLAPHNVPLQWLAEVGLVGFALGLGAFLALIAAALARTREKTDADAAPRDGYRVAAGAAGVAWLVHAVFDWDWDIPGVTVPALLLLGVAAARPAATPAIAASPRPGRGAALAAATVLGLAALVSSVLPALAETRTESALRAGGDPLATPEGLRDAVAEAELASRLNPLAPEPLYAAASIDERRSSFAAARRTLLRALERAPDDVDGWIRLARVEAALGNDAGVRRAAQRAAELDPLGAVALPLAIEAAILALPPERSATATGAPLPEQVPVTDPRPPLPGTEPEPTPTPSATPTPAPTPTATP